MKKNSRHESTMKLAYPGQWVRKISRKPFKSKLHVHTVKNIIDHPHLPGVKAYTFDEDESIVRCSQCCIVFLKPL